VCVCVCIYIYVCVCVCVCVYIYIYIYIYSAVPLNRIHKRKGQLISNQSNKQYKNTKDIEKLVNRLIKKTIQVQFNSVVII